MQDQKRSRAENSTACYCEVGLTASALALQGQYQGTPKQFMDRMALCGAIYVSYMITADIPTYHSCWRSDQVHEKMYMGFREGLANLAFHWRKTHDPKDWEGEDIWMLIYFSLAVWLSLAFTQAPVDMLDEGSDPSKTSPLIGAPTEQETLLAG